MSLEKLRSYLTGGLAIVAASALLIFIQLGEYIKTTFDHALLKSVDFQYLVLADGSTEQYLRYWQGDSNQHPDGNPNFNRVFETPVISNELWQNLINKDDFGFCKRAFPNVNDGDECPSFSTEIVLLEVKNTSERSTGAVSISLKHYLFNRGEKPVAESDAFLFLPVGLERKQHSECAFALANFDDLCGKATETVETIEIDQGIAGSEAVIVPLYIVYRDGKLGQGFNLSWTNRLTAASSIRRQGWPFEREIRVPSHTRKNLSIFHDGYG